jgi:hypothetical protein
MAYIKHENIAGYIIGEEHVCVKCATSDEQGDVELDNIILAEDDKEGAIYCDRCKRKITKTQ